MWLHKQQKQWLHAMYQTAGLSLGMRAYQRNFLGNHGQALALSYPHIQSVLGDAVFRFYAQQYLCQFPIRSGDLNDYGEFFYQLFLQTDQKEHLWIADLARMEWAILRCLLAADEKSSDVLTLAQNSELQIKRVALVAACCVLSLHYPVHEILDASDDASASSPTKRHCHLLLYRRDSNVHWREISNAEAHFVAALSAQRVTVDALSTTLQKFTEFVPSNILLCLLGNNLLLKEATK